MTDDLDNQDWTLFEVDYTKLDEELRRQKRLRREWSFRLAEARAAHSRAEAILDVTYAELDKDIRKNWAKPPYDLEKAPTEPAVKQTIILQGIHQRAVDAVIDAKERVDKLWAMVQQMDDRRVELENTIKLFLANYYPEPLLPTNFRNSITTDRRDEE